MSLNLENLDNMRVVNVFTSGTFTDAHGTELTFTRDDLLKTTAAYNSLSKEKGKAPCYIGHPPGEATSYGEIVFLAVKGDKMMAMVDPKPELTQWVKKGDLNAVSMSFFQSGSPENPYPGIYYPRHLGFLGRLNGMRPALKHLDPLAFMEGKPLPVVFRDSKQYVYFSQYDSIVDRRQASIDRLTHEFSTAANVSYEESHRVILGLWSY